MTRPDTKDAVDAITEQWHREMPELDLETMAIFGRLHRASALTKRTLLRVFADYGISLNEFDVLATLRRSGDPFELSPKELSGTLMLTSGGLTGRLDKLERAGLLERLPDPNDRRGLRIRLTAGGKQVAEASVVDEIDTLSGVLDSALSRDEKKTLGELLRKLHAAYAGETID